MRTTGFIAFFALLAASCHQSKTPKNILPKEKIKAVMWDMMLADHYLTDNIFSKDTSLNRSEESIKLYQQVFYIHKTTKEEFYQSLDHYKSKPEELKILFDSLENWKPASMRDTLTKTQRDTASQHELTPELLKTN